MPHPSIPARIQLIYEYIYDPCDAPVQVYLTAFWPAFFTAVVEYYALDLAQVLTSYLRPRQAWKQYRTSGHRSRDRKKGKPKTWLRGWLRWLTCDPNDLIAGRLPGAKEIGNRRASHSVHFLWTVFGIWERYQNFIFIIELATRTAYKTIIAVENTGYCGEQRRGWGMARDDITGNVPVLSRTPVPVWEIVKQRGGVSFSGPVGSVAAYGGNCFFTGTITQLGDNPIPANARLILVNLTTGEEDEAAYTADEPSPACNLRANGQNTWAFYCAGDGFFSVVDPQVTIIQNMAPFGEV